MAAQTAKIQINNEKIRIVMVGKTGAGKSATANTILGKKVFESMFSPDCVTEKCEKADSELDGQKVSVIDTPGLFDTKVDKETTCKNIAQCVAFASPGPHIFLIVIRLGRFTEEEKETVQMIQKIFGEEVHKYSMVLFTHGDLLKGRTIEEFLRKSEELQELVEKCNGQYHVFNNELKDRSQVTELLNKIRNITEKNGGNHYTTKMLQEAERVIEEEKERIMKEEAEKMRGEEEALKKGLEKEYEQRIREAEDEKERERELRAELQRELEIRTAELRKQQEMEARRRAEESEKVITAIIVTAGVAVLVGTGIGIAGVGIAAALEAGAAGATAAIDFGAGAGALEAGAALASIVGEAATACSIS